MTIGLKRMAGVALAALLAAGSAFGQAFEEGRIVTILIYGQPGSAVDLSTRQMAAALEKELPGTPFQVENRPGGGAQRAIQELSTTKADGYTFGLLPFPTTVAIIPNPERQAAFTKENFAPIAGFMYDPAAIAVAADSEFQSLSDLLEAAKTAPAGVNIAVMTAGNREHLDALTMEKAAGVDITPIHYTDSALALNAVLTRNVQAVQGSVADFVPQLQSGRIRLLAVFDKERSQFAPDTPTAKEQGVELQSGVMRAFAYPAGVSPEQVETISKAIEKITLDPAHAETARKMGFVMRYISPAELDAYWDAETVRIKELTAAQQ